MAQLKKAWFMLLELVLRFVINPYLRARLLSLCGATVGRNVRIYETQFFNLDDGFTNLHIESDVHIGTGCRMDLEGRIYIHHGATISPGVTILTHDNPGSQHNSPLCKHFRPHVDTVEIGAYCWIGANATILAGSRILDRTVIGACSLVNGCLEADSVYVGTPTKKTRSLDFDEGDSLSTTS